MKKQVLKTFSILMITSLLIGCSNIGGGTSGLEDPLKNISKDQIAKERKEALSVSGLTASGRIDVEAELLGETPSFSGERKHPTKDEKQLISYKFDDEMLNFKLKDDQVIRFEKDSHIKFMSKYKKTPKLRAINNNGNMYFVDESEEPINYFLNTKLRNDGEIFLMDGNQGSTLIISGEYTGSGNINLGLYIDKDNNLTTDKIHIKGKTELSGERSKINFIYNKELLKKVETPNSPNPVKDDYVIKLDGEIKSDSDGNTPGERFYMKKDNIPYGDKVYELKYVPKSKAETGTKGETKPESTSHIWKLEKKN